MRVIIVVLSSLLVAPLAIAATPLSASESAGLTKYCALLHQKNKLPAATQKPQCECFLKQAVLLDPIARNILVLAGEDKSDAIMEEFLKVTDEAESAALRREVSNTTPQLFNACAPKPGTEK